MIEAVITHSLRDRRVHMDDAALSVMHELRDFMFERVYQSDEQRRQQRDAVDVLRELMDHYMANPDGSAGELSPGRCAGRGARR